VVHPCHIEAGKTVYWVTSVEVVDEQPITLYGATIRHTLTGPAEFVEARADDGDTC
jgi:hypothetical protein